MKIKILLLLCIATLGLASCKKETIVQETQNKTIIYDIQPNQWVQSANKLTLSNVYSNLPEIDSYGLANEGVLVYISYDNAKSYIALPFTYELDSYSYQVEQGKLTLFIQSSDAQDNIPLTPNTTIKVKVVIVASNNVS